MKAFEPRKLASRALAGHSYQTHERAYHLWLQLPEPWRSDTFVEQARLRGVAVTPAQAFVVGRGAPPAAVRLCLGAARDAVQLEASLSILADVLYGPPDAAPPIV